MNISLEAISFNHDPNSAATDAFTIRKNQSEDVIVPEWKRGMTRPEESPAAYSIRQISANTLTIEAQFRREASDPTTVEIHADASPGNVLGNVKSRTINFGNQLSTSELFDLDTRGGNPGVGVADIGWNWFVNGARLQTTQHRIYTILDEPQDPWGQPGSGFQTPWTEVLEHACRVAARARNADEAAEMLTRWVFSLGPRVLRYDELSSGSSNFTIPGMRTFKCTKFLRVLAGELPTPARVNCTDCATILSSFANILGCSLTQSRIGVEFKTNRIKKIGVDSSIGEPFRFHEVAWKFQREGIAASLYDCCLQTDEDGDPTDSNFSPGLGINMPLGVPGRDGYEFRLIEPNRNGRAYGEMCRTRLRRKIDGLRTTRVTMDSEQRRGLEREYGFPEWKASPSKPKHLCGSRYKDEGVASAEVSTSDQQLFLKNYNFKKGLQSPDGWTAGVIESFEAEPDPLRLTDVVWSKMSEKDSGEALRVLTYECSSIAAARSFLLTLLAEFNLFGIKRRVNFVVDDKKVKIGDVAFAGPHDLVLLFARGNNVVLIQNVGQKLVPVSQFALALDTDMTSSPDPKKEHLIEMNEFYVSNQEIRVGQEVRIHTKSEQVTQEKDLLLKFFTPAGRVFTKGDDLLYHPRKPGKQSITILAHKAGEKSARQVLSLFAEPPATAQ